jgi:cbb3-type cytochrome oxidase subunit 3
MSKRMDGKFPDGGMESLNASIGLIFYSILILIVIIIISLVYIAFYIRKKPKKSFNNCINNNEIIRLTLNDYSIKGNWDISQINKENNGN